MIIIIIIIYSDNKHFPAQNLKRLPTKTIIVYNNNKLCVACALSLNYKRSIQKHIIISNNIC